MENDGELSELKEVYDELWSDARTLIKDMRNSISVYFYAGFLTFLVSFVTGSSAFANFMTILSGNGGFWTWYNAVMGTVGTIVFVAFGAKLLQWYLRLKRKYSKLIQMEKNIGDK